MAAVKPIPDVFSLYIAVAAVAHAVRLLSHTITTHTIGLTSSLGILVKAVSVVRFAGT